MKKLLITITVALIGCTGTQSFAGPNDAIGDLLKHAHPASVILQPTEPMEPMFHTYQFGTNLPVRCFTMGSMTHCM
jgi:hypothetical protein